MKNKSKLLFSYIAVFFIFFISCEKDFYEDIDLQKEKIKEIDIKTITYEDFSRKMQALKTKPAVKMIMNKANSSSSNHYARSGDDSDIEIFTDIIKEITSGTYKSYTMYIKTPDSLEHKFYNLTLEEKEGETAAFITKYSPTENWINNKDIPFEGGITTFRAEPSGDGSIKFADINDGGGGGGGSTGISSTYPHNCDGYVRTTVIEIPKMCSENVHWPWTVGAFSSCEASVKARYETVYLYECIANNFNNPGSGSTGNGGYSPGGGSNSSGNAGDESITTPVIRFLNNPDPCQKYKEILDPQKQNLNFYINDLAAKHQASEKNEVSYSFSKIPQYNPATDDYSAFVYGAAYKVGTPTAVKINTGTRWYAAIHLHPKDLAEAAGIFSWLDIRTLNDMYNEVHLDYQSDNSVSLMVLAPDPLNFNNFNVYAISVKNKVALNMAINNEWNSPKWARYPDEQDRIDQIQKELGDNYVKNKNNLERFFLDKFSSYGISLFKLENNQWNELLPVSNSQNILKKPCN